MEAADEDEKKHIFPFMELPPELRDLIYEQTVQTEIKSTLKHRDTVLPYERAIATFKSIRVPAMLLVSRQFGQEYRKRALSKEAVSVIDHMEYKFAPILLQDDIRNIRVVELNLLANAKFELNLRANATFNADSYLNYTPPQISTFRPLLAALSARQACIVRVFVVT